MYQVITRVTLTGSMSSLIEKRSAFIEHGTSVRDKRLYTRVPSSYSVSAHLWSDPSARHMPGLMEHSRKAETLSPDARWASNPPSTVLDADANALLTFRYHLGKLRRLQGGALRNSS